MPNEPTFSDIQNHWAQVCIKELAQRQLISGYPDGRFRPDNPVTRAEFAAIVRKAFPKAVPIRSAINFADVPPKHWAYQAIQTAYQTGFLSGYPNRIFKPNDPILRLHSIIALVSGLKYGVTTAPSETLRKYFDDANQIPGWAAGAVTAATEQYLVVNYPNVRRLNPNQNATRGEVAGLICRALDIPGVPSKYIPGMNFIVIEPQFDQADSFSQGLARVKIGNQWGYIDKQGKFVLQREFEEAESFAEGVALVRKIN